jgi:hypothetical protein
VLAQALSSIQWHKNQDRLAEMDSWIEFLKNAFKK